MSVSLDELRCVEWELAGGSTRRELVPENDVASLVRAVLALHHDPGINPHSQSPAAQLLRLEVGVPRLEGGPWWAGPSLDDDGPRARLVRWTFTSRFDQRPADDPPDPV